MSDWLNYFDEISQVKFIVKDINPYTTMQNYILRLKALTIKFHYNIISLERL